MEDILKELGLSPKQIATVSAIITAEERPEDWQEQIQTVASDYKEIILLDNKPDPKEFETAAYGKFVNERRAYLRKTYDFTKEELEGKSIKELNALEKKYYEDKVAEASNSTDEEKVKMITKYQNELQEAQRKLKEWDETYDQKVQAAKQSAEETIRGYEVNALLSSKLNDPDIIEFGDPSRRAFDEKTIKRDLVDLYNIYGDGRIEDKGGTRARAISGDGFYDTVDDAIRDYADYHKISKKSNSEPNNHVKDKRVIIDPDNSEKKVIKSVTKVSDMFN